MKGNQCQKKVHIYLYDFFTVKGETVATRKTVRETGKKKTKAWVLNIPLCCGDYPSSLTGDVSGEPQPQSDPPMVADTTPEK
jgi:hypothetical protein